MKKATWAFWVICFSLVIMVIAGCSSDDDDPVLDRTPAAFSFTSVNGVVLTELVTSEPITIAGLSAAATAPISVSADSVYAINGGAYVTTDGTVVNGDTVTVQHTSAATEATATVTTLTIGGVSGTFTSTTTTATLTFSFPSKTGVPLTTLITSDPITIADLTAAAEISVSPSSAYAINSGSYVTTIGTVVNGDTVTVQHTSAATGATAKVTILTIGGVTGTFTSTTLALAPVAGQLVYDANCASCHMLGTYDTVGTEADLAGAGAQLTSANRYPTPGVAGHQGIILSAPQIADLATFLNSF